MLGKRSNKVYDSFLKAGLGYQNIERLKKAIAAQPKMYDGERLHNTKLIIDSQDSEETLEDAEESQLKMKNKMIQLNYAKLNALYETFVSQKEFSAEQTYFQLLLLLMYLLNSRVKRALFTSPVATKSRDLGATSVVAKSRFNVARTPTATNKASSASSLSPDSSDPTCLLDYNSGCSKHMTGNLQLLRNFIEKFIGTVRFRNDHFTTITGYGDFVQGNLTICHVYYVEVLGHNLFSVGQFCDGDLEVAFRLNTCYVWNLEGDYLVTGCRDSNLYTNSIFELAASSPANEGSKYQWQEIYSGYRRSLFLIHLGPSFNCSNFQDSLEDSQTVPSKEDLDNFFENKAPQLVTSSEEPISNEATTLVSNENANELVQEVVVSFDGNELYNPFHSPVLEEAESSLTFQDPSNMHKLYQPHHSTDKWTKIHPIEQVTGDPSKPVMTRRRLYTDVKICLYALTMSTTKPKNIKEAMLDHSWIESMQDELNQFKCLDVWELVERPVGRNMIVVKWIWKKKTDAENTVIQNKSPLVAKGYGQVMGVHQSPRGIFIYQSQYTLDLLKKHGMEKCDTISTPMATAKLDAFTKVLIMAQQIILADQLVPKFQGFRRCNDYVVLQNIPCSPECKIVGHILLDHPLSYALTAIADVLTVYLQQFWKTVSMVPYTKETIKFKLNSQEIIYTVDMFRSTLQLPVETPENPFIAPKTIRVIEPFMQKVGYQCVVDKDDIPLVSVYSTGNVLFQRMLISNAFLTDEIRATDDYKEYEMVLVKVVVPTIQLQPVVSTQGTHRTTPSAHRSPTLTTATPQKKKKKKKKRKQVAGEQVHQENHSKLPSDKRRNLSLHKTTIAVEAQENVAKVQEKLEEEEKEKMVEGKDDDESYASEFPDSVFNDNDDSSTRIKPESHNENPETVDDDDETEKEKKDEKKDDIEDKDNDDQTDHTLVGN
ncbi:integrase, catalytic region, zinc finger, CCHC-type containing protein [Tanacetum coccineum]|uniref:Integrase, catalytic region, zinc finger, CCHC-type containing protein n=1 Tax=Tanacetum coccineum TaxID=301880 RepID=A0ABQ5AHH4_9ASTR